MDGAISLPKDVVLVPRKTGRPTQSLPSANLLLAENTLITHYLHRCWEAKKPVCAGRRPSRAGRAIGALSRGPRKSSLVSLERSRTGLSSPRENFPWPSGPPCTGPARPPPLVKVVKISPLGACRGRLGVGRHLCRMPSERSWTGLACSQTTFSWPDGPRARGPTGSP